MIIIAYNDLCRVLQNFIEERYLIACVGSPLRSDDRVAIELCEEVKKRGIDRLLGFDILCCEYGLEFCTMDIEKLKPRKILIIDAVIVPNLKPGAVVLIDEEELEEFESTVSTHTIPLKQVLKYIRTVVRIDKVKVLGIQVATLELGDEISMPVKQTLDKILACFNEI